MNTVRSSDGTTIAFDRRGTGPAVIYVSPAFSHRAFDPGMAQVASLLASQFTVFTYDVAVAATARTPPRTLSSARSTTSLR